MADFLPVRREIAIGTARWKEVRIEVSAENKPLVKPETK
jgi:hypothetical protein